MPFMPFAIFGLWFRGLLALGLVGGGNLAPRHLVRRAPASHPGAPDGYRRHAHPGPAAVRARACDPLAPRFYLGDGRLGGRPPAGAGSERRRAVALPPAVAGRNACACPPAGAYRRAPARPGRDDAASRDLRSPGGAAAAGDPWLGRHQRAVVLPPPGCGGAVPPRRMGFTGPGPLDAPRTVRV